ncbi:MAG TPA: hypothetical protein VFA07_15525 [Chthonomonadaceae bacterium]|nr:hypothetical protein [Chthonomonadaceae bacterium]
MMNAMLGAMMILMMATAADSLPTYDRYGGWTGIHGTKTGFFHAEKVGEKWWLIDPDGNGFFSKGVCHVSFAGDNCPALGYSPYERAVTAKYGDREGWASATVHRMKGWGLNTAGAWSDDDLHKHGLVYAPIADLAAASVPNLWLHGGFPDVFSDSFREGVNKQAETFCGPRKNDRWLLGYFTDNELRWGPDWRSKQSLLETFLHLPDGSPGRKRAEAFMAEHGNASGPPTDEQKAEFLELAAGEYFRICAAAIRRSDPNHLILGCRFAGYAPDPVVRGIRDSVDVVSYNNYSHQAPMEMLRHLSELTGKPLMVTEFSFKAMDSGLPNSKGGGRPVGTQQERADLFQGYVEAIAALPSCVGYHWFEWSDEPKQGRFDGEDCNYGLIKIDDSPWELLTTRLREVNARLESLHAP